MFIGKIYTDCKIDNINELIGVYCIDSYNKNDIDTNIPLLFVGKSNSESIFGVDKVHVLNKKISDNIYWTFSKYEKHNIFESDINKFVDYCFNKIKNGVSYTFFNLFTSKYTIIKDFIKTVIDSKSIIYFGLETIYIYVQEKNMIYGISKEQLDMINISYEKIIARFSNIENIKFLFNKDFLDKSILFKLKDNIKLIPYLFYLNM